MECKKRLVQRTNVDDEQRTPEQDGQIVCPGLRIEDISDSKQK